MQLLAVERFLLLALTGILAGCVANSSTSDSSGTTDTSSSSSASTSASTSTDYTDGNTGLDPTLFPNQRIQGEPDDSLSQALEVILDSSGIGHVQGTIQSANDIDVYSLGSLAAGDRIIIDVGTPDGTLDAEVAVFDENVLLAFENDDRNLDLGQLDPFINDITRYASRYYLGITGSAFANRGQATGRYEILITVVPGNAIPATSAQIVVLNFNGGSITIPGSGTYTVGAFDTADIARAYTSMTATVRNQIAATTRQNYEGLALDVRVLPGDTAPADGQQYSTVYFGGSNPDAYGISQEVDPYNADHSDCSIMFTDMFTPQVFGRVLTATELGTAIGNVASHEIGHLLGLNHVDDVYDLMDTTGTAPTFLYDQTFTTSALDDMIFPIGNQDGLLLLQETLGSSGQ